VGTYVTLPGITGFCDAMTNMEMVELPTGYQSGMLDRAALEYADQRHVAY
jgi:uncharacterized membrane protein YoaK (UPF0700 family)